MNKTSFQITDKLKSDTTRRGIPFITVKGFFIDDKVINNDISQINFPQEYTCNVFMNTTPNLYCVLLKINSLPLPLIQVNRNCCKKFDMSTYTDESVMPFGKYKGKKLANVPPEYLLWLYENGDIYGDLKAYIKENLDVIKAEIKQNEKHKRT